MYSWKIATIPFFSPWSFISLALSPRAPTLKGISIFRHLIRDLKNGLKCHRLEAKGICFYSAKVSENPRRSGTVWEMTLEQVLIFVQLDLFFQSDFKVSSWTSFRVFTLDWLWLKILPSAGSNANDVSRSRLSGPLSHSKTTTSCETTSQAGACALKSQQLAIAIQSYCALALIRPNQVPFKLLNAADR